jgi:hypothetical protein
VGHQRELVGGMELDQAAWRLLHDFAGEHPRAVALGHAVLAVDLDADQLERFEFIGCRLNSFFTWVCAA